MHSHLRFSQSRRAFLRDSFCGFGSLALLSLLHDEQLRADPADPLAPRPPHFAPKARSVIFLYMAGGPSHLETFDPKPLLNRLHGQRRPTEFGEARYQFIQPDARLLGSARRFARHGQSGTEISDLFPNLARCADDLAVLRGCYGDMVVHSAAQYELFTGRTVPGFPSMGAWSVYGLGSEGRTLPAYVVMPDPDGALAGGQPMYTHGFLPAVYQPTMFSSGPQPVRNLGLPPHVTPAQRAETVRLIEQLNRADLAPDDEELAARIRAYELAFRMQTEAPGVFDVTRETAETLRMYGIGTQPTDDYGRSPEAQGGRGRDHHNLGFSMWMAGGGIKAGQVVGATDAIGLQAVEEPYHFRDVHTTILHQLGLDQDRLTYLHLGRQERLTLVQGRVIGKLV